MPAKLPRCQAIPVAIAGGAICGLATGGWSPARLALPGTTLRVAVAGVELTMSDDAGDEDELLPAYRGEEHVQVIGGSPHHVGFLAAAHAVAVAL
jgi:hypothetical protein